MGPSEPKYVSPSFGACKQGGSWHRPGNKPTTLAGFKACRDQCAQQGYQHFGSECPMGSYFHCQCSNTNLGSAVALSTSTCLRNVGHCGGPFTITDTENGVDYYLGAHSYGSVYLVQEALAPPPPPVGGGALPVIQRTCQLCPAGKTAHEKYGQNTCEDNDDAMPDCAPGHAFSLSVRACVACPSGRISETNLNEGALESLRVLSLPPD